MKEQIQRILKSTASQKGFILILALVAMLAMTIIGISLILNMSTDLQLARNEREGKQAFQLAEAGINESVARMRLPTVNAKYVGEPVSVMGDYRAPGGWGGTSFDATTSADGLKYTAAIRYLTEGDSALYCDSAANSVAAAKNTVGGVPASGTLSCNGEVVMYGQDFNICFTSLPCANPSAKKGVYPVYKITSTGTVNTTERTIEAYVGASNLNMDTNAAINTNECINVAGGGGDANVTPAGATLQGAGCGCDTHIGPPCPLKATSDDMTTFLSGDTLASLGSQADVNISCNTMSACNADIGAITDSQWGDCTGDSSSTFIYIDTGAFTGLTINSNDLPANCGRGILIINGNLTISGNVAWEGLVYVMGTLTINGGGNSLNVDGGVMANNTVQMNGGITANYNAQLLEEVGRQAGSSSKTYISWKRL